MRRLITALIVGALLAGAVYGAAATLGGINSASLGADDTAVVSCDSDGVSVDFQTQFLQAGASLPPELGPSPPVLVAGYYVHAVDVSGIHDNCLAEIMRATLTVGSEATSFNQNGPPGSPGYGPGDPAVANDNTTSFWMGLPSLTLAEDVDDLHLSVG